MDNITPNDLERTAKINKYIVSFRKILTDGDDENEKVCALFIALWYYTFDLYGAKAPPMDMMNTLMVQSVRQFKNNLVDYFGSCPPEYHRTNNGDKQDADKITE